MGAMAQEQVRRADVADAAQIALVHVRSWQAAYRGLLPQGLLDQLDPEARAGRWQRILRELDWSAAGAHVSVLDGQVCGFAHFGPSRDAADERRRVGEVVAIYLLPEAWGRGLGRDLMASALSGLAAAGYGSAMLWVLDGNARARRFYARGGWREDGGVKQDEILGARVTEVRYARGLP
jgi:GNAT superfamily N-acetyltransferase